MSSDREKELEEENRKLRQKLAWIHNLMRNDTVQPRDKVVLYELEFELYHSQADDDGMTQIRVWKVSEKTGISTDMVGKSIKFLSEGGVLERQPRYVDSSYGGKEKAIFVKLTDVARNPSQISLPSKGHGGKRTATKFCTSCGHTEHIEERICICTRCGTEFEHKWRTVTEGENTEEEPNE